MSIQYKNSDILSVSNINSLFALKNLDDNQLVQTQGYSIEGLGANIYRYDAGSSATIDGGFTLPGLNGVLSFSGTTFNGTVGTGRFIAVDQSVADVTKFGAVGDSSTDDSQAFKLTAASLTSTGGKIFIPPTRRYKINSEVAVTSNYPISIISHMGPSYTDGLFGGFIFPGATFAGSIFNINCPGGVIRGLHFKDPTSVLGASQGTSSITSCIEATYFSTGIIENCTFDGILGSCIKTARWVRGKIINPHIRDCGDTSKPAIWLNGTSSVYPSQAIVIENAHIEVCYSAPYIELNQYSPDCKIINGQFEADELIAGSQQTFIKTASTNTFIANCGMTVTGDDFVLLTSGKNTVSNCTFNGAPATGKVKLRLANSYNVITGCSFWGTSSDIETSILDSGGNNIFSGNDVYFGGNVILGPFSVWSGGAIYDLKTEEAYALVTNTNCTVSGVSIYSCDVAGGIRVISGSVVTGCTVTSNAGIGIRCESASSTVSGNKSSGNTGGDLSFTAYPHGYHPNMNYAGDGVYPLQVTTTWDPGSLTNGSSVSLNVTVSGVVSGDVAIANFPVLASASSVAGIQISTSAYTSNTVKVTITNNSGGVVDLDSGTLIVKAMKA